MIPTNTLWWSSNRCLNISNAALPHYFLLIDTRRSSTLDVGGWLGVLV
jgi:hypothetical protein